MNHQNNPEADDSLPIDTSEFPKFTFHVSRRVQHARKKEAMKSIMRGEKIGLRTLNRGTWLADRNAFRIQYQAHAQLVQTLKAMKKNPTTN